MSFPTEPIHSPAWFDNCFEGAVVPKDLRQAAETVCKTFTIRGICDPMYVANVLAVELGRGDGCSNFHAADSEAREQFSQRLARAVDRLLCAYSTCIGQAADKLSELLTTSLYPRAQPHH